MKKSQIINVWTDEGDNNQKSLGKGHLSLTRKIHNEIGTKRGRCLKAHIGTLISKKKKKKQLSMSNIYTKWRMKLYTYINTCAYYLLFYFIFLFSFFFHHFFFFAYFEYQTNELHLEYIMTWIYSQKMTYTNSL